LGAVPAETDSLPFVDEHSIEVEADAETTWEATLRVFDGSFASTPTAAIARLLGCADADASGPRPLAAGSAFPGFHVETAVPPRELGLAGSHRFSRYALILRLDPLNGGRTRLRAETRADFPGPTGRAYRGLVIGTRGHVLMLRRLLGAAKRRAERSRS
jgi:hypothetical protein